MQKDQNQKFKLTRGFILEKRLNRYLIRYFYYQWS